MKVCRKCGEEKPLTEFHRDSRARDGLYCYCKPCAIAKARAWQKANPERVNENNRRWRQENPEKVKAIKKKSDPERVRRYKQAWIERNWEQHREATKRWRKANPDKVREKTMRRIADKLRRTPRWLTEDHRAEIRAKYELAAKLSSRIGIQYHVDHIWPLRGKDAWGLHVPWNLQVITAEENLRKHNKRPDHTHVIQELGACPDSIRLGSHSPTANSESGSSLARSPTLASKSISEPAELQLSGL